MRRHQAIEQEVEEVVMESTAETGMGSAGAVLEADLPKTARYRARIGNTTSSASAIESQSAWAQDGFLRCRVSAEAAGGQLADPKLCYPMPNSDCGARKPAGIPRSCRRPKDVAPDLIVHGGDLVFGGTHPADIIDEIRAFGWPGVLGNTDEVLWTQERLTEMAAAHPKLGSLLGKLRELIEPMRARIGDERLSWLKTLPTVHVGDGFAAVHATPRAR